MDANSLLSRTLGWKDTALALVFVATLPAGCIPTLTSSPVGENPVRILAEEWDGIWVPHTGHDSDPEPLVINVLWEDRGTMEVGWLQKSKGHLKLVPLRGEIRKTGNVLMASVKLDRGHYIWAVFEKDGDDLRVWFPTESPTRHLVEIAELPGKLERVGRETKVVLGSLSREQVVFLTARTRTFFDWERPVVYRRYSHGP